MGLERRWPALGLVGQAVTALTTGLQAGYEVSAIGILILWPISWYVITSLEPDTCVTLSLSLGNSCSSPSSVGAEEWGRKGSLTCGSHFIELLNEASVSSEHLLRARQS